MKQCVLLKHALRMEGSAADIKAIHFCGADFDALFVDFGIERASIFGRPWWSLRRSIRPRRRDRLEVAYASSG